MTDQPESTAVSTENPETVSVGDGAQKENPELQAGAKINAKVLQIYGDCVIASFNENQKAHLSLNDFPEPPQIGHEFAAKILTETYPVRDGIYPIAALEANRDKQELGYFSRRLLTLTFEIEANRKTGDTTPFTHTTPRTLLRAIGGHRRTRGNVSYINYALRELGLKTNPHFNVYGIDDAVKLFRIEDLESESNLNTASGDANATDQGSDSANTSDSDSIETDFDPVHRISRFFPEQEIVSIDRNAPLDKAITLMLMHDFSQLPVMQSERDLQGLISWRSIGTSRLLKSSVSTVADCTERCYEISEDDSIFAAVRSISEHDVVMVRAHDKRVAGILTAADVSGIFEEISRPFILISYVENHLRSLLQANFTIQELAAAKDPGDADREIKSVANMTFGEYVRLLSSQDNWDKLGLNLDRKTIVQQLEDVRRIRNEVMHFDPEGIEEKDMLVLRKSSQLLEMLTNQL